jgi:hypothetical protein
LNELENNTNRKHIHKRMYVPEMFLLFNLIVSVK